MPEIDNDQLTIFSTPGCVQCNASERHAKARKIPYQKIDVTEVPEAHVFVSELGYSRAPILYYKGKHVGGFDPGFLADVENDVTAKIAA